MNETKIVFFIQIFEMLTRSRKPLVTVNKVGYVFAMVIWSGIIDIPRNMLSKRH